MLYDKDPMNPTHHDEDPGIPRCLSFSVEACTHTLWLQTPCCPLVAPLLPCPSPDLLDQLALTSGF